MSQLTKGHWVGHVFIGLPSPIQVPGSTNLTNYIGYYPNAKNKIRHLHGPGGWADDTILSDSKRTTTETFKVCPSTLESIKGNITQNSDNQGYNLFGIWYPNCRTIAEDVLEDAGLHPKGGGYEPATVGDRKGGCVVSVTF